MTKKIFFVIFLLFFFQASSASSALYSFHTPQQQQRFQNLTNDLRCLVCQNENLADSNAPLAADLRREIASLINSGQSDQQIIHYLVVRYGDFILFRPPLMTTTLLLWLAPFFLVVFGLLALCLRIVYLRRTNQNLILSADQRRLAEKILQE
jgi:cytochrome c-type biogenesis protein CcmH